MNILYLYGKLLINRIKIMSSADEIPSVCVNPEVFQIPVMFKKNVNVEGKMSFTGGR